MLTLKQDNERLQRQVEQQSAVSSQHHTFDRRTQRRSPDDETFVINDKFHLNLFSFQHILLIIKCC